jgi:hypothetical protein
MNIEFRVIAPKKGTIQRQAWESIKSQLIETVEDRLRSIECSEHHQRPRVVIGGSLERPEFEVQGCCQDLIDQAMEALK